MRNLVLSASGRYWYRADHCPTGAVDLYCTSRQKAEAVAAREGVPALAEDLSWLDAAVVGFPCRNCGRPCAPYPDGLCAPCILALEPRQRQ